MTRGHDTASRTKIAGTVVIRPAGNERVKFFPGAFKQTEPRF